MVTVALTPFLPKSCESLCNSRIIVDTHNVGVFLKQILFISHPYKGEEATVLNNHKKGRQTPPFHTYII